MPEDTTTDATGQKPEARKPMTIRVTEAERAAIQAKAAEFGFTEVSAYIRSVAINAQIVSMPETKARSKIWE